METENELDIDWWLYEPDIYKLFHTLRSLTFDGSYIKKCYTMFEGE